MSDRKKRQQTEAYTRAFQQFLSYTDEKEVLLRKIVASIGCRQKFLLDIGAGSGELAVPLSRYVEFYAAFEHNEYHAVRLERITKRPVLRTFPQPLPWEFDVVLMSHSLPWKPEEYEPFIRAGWKFVKHGGVLIIITYDDEHGQWNELLDACDLKRERVLHNRLGTLLAWISKALPCRLYTRSIRTWVRTKTLSAMQDALAFVYSDGEEEKRQQFLCHEGIPRILRQAYRSADGYAFPFDHVYVEVVERT